MICVAGFIDNHITTTVAIFAMQSIWRWSLYNAATITVQIGIGIRKNGGIYNSVMISSKCRRWWRDIEIDR